MSPRTKEYTERINVFFSPEQLARVKAEAAAAGVSVSTYIRVKMVMTRPASKWDFIGDNLYQCTECGYVNTSNWLEDWRAHTNDPTLPPYCPNCGAKKVTKA